MTPQHSTFAARLAICGVIAGIVLLVVIIAAVVTSSTRTAPIQIAVGPFELAADEQHVSFIIIIHGDASWFREHLTMKAWTQEFSLGGLRPDGPSIDLRKTIGTPVHGRQIRFYTPSWWLVTLCFLPALWRRGKTIRTIRAALREGCCTLCGYDLRGSGGRCPECGADKVSGHRYLYAINPRMWRRRPVLTTLAALSGLAMIAIISVAIFYKAAPHADRIKLNLARWGMQLDNERLYLFTADLQTDPRARFWFGRTFGIPSLGVEWSTSPHTSGDFTLTLHFFPLILLLLIVPIVWCRIRRRDLKTIAARCCQHCWFDMQGATGPCPRCARVR